MSEWKETKIGLIPKDWEILPLSDLIEFTVDNRGKTAPTVEHKTNYPLIATNCIKEFALFPVKENLRFVSQETYQSWFRSHPKPGDIIIVNKGTPGLVCFVPYPVDFCIAQDMIAIRTNEKIYNKYLFAYMRSHYFKHQVRGLNVGTTIPHLKKTVFQEIKIPIPDNFDYQKIAGDTYFSLSLKIENLRRQNETLEKIAQTLFKHWFIDFEFPNDDGKPYKSSGGAMVASELGDIPAGWRVGKMQNIIEVRDGTHDSPKQSDKGFKLITSKHLKKEGIDFDSAYFISENDYVEINKRSKVETFDILLSMIGTVGLLYFVQEKSISFAIKNIGLFKTSQNLNYSEYIYLFIKSNYGETYLKTRLAGTTQSYITLGALRDMPLIVPSSRVLSQFKQIAKSIFDKDYFNKQQIQTLTKKRDALLPKLMSGEIRIQSVGEEQ